MQLSPRTKATLLLTVVVILAGCTTILGDSTEEEFLDRLETAEPPEQLSATQENVFGTGEDEIDLAQDIWVRDTGESRFESSEASEWLTVSDGEQLWEYYPDEDRVVEREVPAVEDSLIDELYTLSEELIADFTIERVEETTFDGNTVYHVSLEPPTNETDSVDESILDVIRQPLSPGAGAEDAASEATEANVTGDPAEVDAVELYFERETMFPVKTLIVTDESRSETTYRNASFEPISDDKFEFEPPSDATVEESELPDRTEFETLAEAIDYADLPLAEPTTIPEEFERDGIAVTEWDERDETRLSVTYEGEGSEFMSLVMTDEAVDFADHGKAESVQIGKQQGVYEMDEDVGLQLVEWDCESYELAITAPDTVDREELLDMAESTGCE